MTFVGQIRMPLKFLIAFALLDFSSKVYGRPASSSGVLSPASEWKIDNLKSIVAFGDSYTDEQRLSYFINHNGTAPPVGWVQPVTYPTADGGYVWARYVSWYTRANLYNYAVSGAVCSNAITPRHFDAINTTFPSVLEYEVPAFLVDKVYIEPNSRKPFLDLPAAETVYALWIGTNDLGNNAFITNSQIKGKTLDDYVGCVFEVLNKLYVAGGRNFILLNNTPLDLAPQYATIANGGVTKSRFWQDKPADIDGISRKMSYQVQVANTAMRSRMEALGRQYSEGKFALFDTHELFENVYKNPRNYLNGTEKPNVSSWINQCDGQGNNCTPKPSPDSYLWYDELHPSEQADRVVAREFVKVVNGSSSYAIYY
ncbi:hypothetical protein EJ08DRAFT_628689 [Tothia fuscella]|uniref:Uncharacterized protein n=1 Tax=Tothia fuscella TaxID=1048955 RepID=A0A9P4NXK7_9PEZI|nr:hypothetical protein EJ08DRAFT_628689 [Tothia fuscella]